MNRRRSDRFSSGAWLQGRAWLQSATLRGSSWLRAATLQGLVLSLSAAVGLAEDRGVPPLHPDTVIDAGLQAQGLPPMHPGTVADAETQSGTPDIQPPKPEAPLHESLTAEQYPADWPAEEQPTEETRQRTIAVPAAPKGPPTGPRDLLRRLNVDDSYFEHIQPYIPLQASEDEVVLQILDRLPQFRLEDLERWAAPVFPVDDVFPDPDAYRGEAFWLAGRLTGMKPVKLIPEVAERYGAWGYWWCTVRLASSNVEAIVLSRKVPEAWRRKLAEGKPLDERVTAYTLFVKFTNKSPDHPQPLFTTRRIAWHPPTPLGNLGYDVGLLDEARNAKPLTAHDREAFYAMLAAVGRAEPGQLMRQAQERLKTAPEESVRLDDEGNLDFSVVPLFNDPDNQRGKLFFLEGTVRRAERIEVHDPDIRARFGIDHYYQLALFTSDSRNPGGHRNPVWFCVRDMPEGMPLGTEANYSERARIAGFFLKTWAYRRGMLPGADASASTPPMQLSPLLIGREPIYIPRPPPMALHPMVGVTAGGLFLAAIVGIWIVVWRCNRADREFQRVTLAKHYQVAEGASLDQLGIEAADGPDFSALSEADRGPRTDSDGA